MIRASFFCAVSLLIGGAWAFHVAEAHHGAADKDCQVCAVSVSPQLNSDCGSPLLARPEKFVLAEPAAPAVQVITIVSAPFFGRAPPPIRS